MSVTPVFTCAVEVQCALLYIMFSVNAFKSYIKLYLMIVSNDLLIHITVYFDPVDLVHKFNKQCLPPDIEVEEMFHMVSRPVTNYPQIGFKLVSTVLHLLIILLNMQDLFVV